MNQALILVEGQTEERFVKQVLRPHLWGFSLDLAPTIVVTKRVKAGGSFRGGVTTFDHFERDARRLLGSGGVLVTTMLDYYRLPDDFPGMNDRPSGPSVDRVLHVEDTIESHFGRPANLKVFLTLHEFEALLFSDVSGLANAIAQPGIEQDLQSELAPFASPEEINEQPGQSPANRIRSLYPGYRKALFGPTAAERIGLPTIRAKCDHFREWLEFLENWATDS